MARCCIWVRGSSEQKHKQKTLPYLVPSMHKTSDVKSSTNSDRTWIFPGRRKSLTHQHRRGSLNEIHLSLHDIPKLILICGRHGTSTRRSLDDLLVSYLGWRISVGAHVHPVNSARLIVRTLYEHFTTLYLVWSPVPK